MIESPALQFGLSIHPGREDRVQALAWARLAEKLGLDLITVMDHPYHRGHLDTWTLLTWLAGVTERIHLAPNVANLPLRPPAMLAKMAATLDVLSGGRFELAIGAGASWDGIHAFGGPRRDSSEAYLAFKEGLQIIRSLLDGSGQPFTFEGEHYSVRGARFGPAPAGRLPIWTGAYGPSMQRLTGQLADGVIVSYGYARPEQLATFNERLDEGALSAGRSPSEIRRAYNIFGRVIRDGESTGDDERQFVATPEVWIDTLARWAGDYRQDTFIFWPSGPDPARQIETFAQEIVPVLREELSAGSPG